MDYNYRTEVNKASVILLNSKDKDCKHEEIVQSVYTVDGGIPLWFCKKCGSTFRVNYESAPSVKII